MNMENALGRAIRNARGEMSIRQLARLAELDAGQISRIESGERADPQYSTLVKIANALNISVAALLGDEKSEPPVRPDRAIPQAVLARVNELAAEVVSLREDLAATAELDARFRAEVVDVLESLFDAKDSHEPSSLKRLIARFRGAA